MAKFGIDSNMVFDADGKSVATRLSDHDTSLSVTNQNVTNNVAAIGTLSQLNTDDKSSIVNALKEVKSQANTNGITMSSLNAGPKGVYATLSALQTAFPTGNSNIYLVTADGKWYYWNGTTWTPGGVYQSTGIANGSVSPIQTNFMLLGKNLFNPATTSDNFILNYTTGALQANTSFSTSDYIQVVSGTNYICNFQTVLCFYDSNKTFISGIQVNSATSVITPPTNSVYMKISFGWTVWATQKPLLQVELGTASTSYETYGYSLGLSYVPPTITNAKNIMYAKLDSSSDLLRIAWKYNDANDFWLDIKKNPTNGLPDIFGTWTAQNTGNVVSNDLSRTATQLEQQNTDWFGPYIVQANNNANGDNSLQYQFTGGWHGYTGGLSGAKTANNYRYEIYVDGKRLQAGQQLGVVNKITIIISNGINGWNTTLANGSGRDIIQEIRYVTITPGEIFSETEIKALEDVTFSKHYGLQTIFQGHYKSIGTIFYYDGKGTYTCTDDNNVTYTYDNERNKMLLTFNNPSTVIHGSGSTLTGSTSNRIAIDDNLGNIKEMYLIPNFGLSKRTYVDNNIDWMFSSPGKTYCNLINLTTNVVLKANEQFFYRGGYRFYSK